MRPALIALFATLVLVGCKDGDSCDGACKTTDAKYGIADRSIHAVDQRKFTAFDGNTYTLLRLEYGAQDCDDLDGECSYSVYCGFVVNGEEFPLYNDYVIDEDALFDDDDGLSGYDLAIFDDDAFDTWLWETDEDDDVLIGCFDDY